MQHISLFSGIGGFDLASEWMGWTNVASCEINPFGRKVLDYYWPDAYHHDDIHTLTKELLIEKSNWNEQESTILTGGFPCQPYSNAGKRLGKEDERHLWPEMLRVIRSIRPRWVVGENVRGIISWSEGLVFEEVQADLEKEGYEVWAFLLPACGVNAPHRRDRVWFVAHSNDIRSNQPKESTEQQGRAETRTTGKSNGNGDASDTNSQQSERMRPEQRELGEQKQRQFRGIGSEVGYGPAPNPQLHGCATAQGRRGDGEDSQRSEKGENCTKQFTGVCKSGQLGGIQQDAADTDNGQRIEQEGQVQAGWNTSHSSHKPNATNANSRRQPCEEHGQTKSRRFTEKGISSNWQNFPTQPPICGGNDGLPTELDGITFPKWRNESIKGYGNAIVPQVALQIFKTIEEFER